MEPLTGIAALGIDWGTTQRRAYLLNANGMCVGEHTDAQGALACKGRFPQALGELLEQLAVKPQLIILSGMVGSALGWQEVPYVGGQVPLQDLPRHLVPVTDAPDGVRCVIVPGYCVRNPQGQADVMRGEETQLLGAAVSGRHSGWFVLPGTHSKWVKLDAGRVVALRTYMTGELFSLLTQHGTLAAAAGTASQIWSDEAFGEGVKAANPGDKPSAHHSALSHQLFGCRARVVCGDMAATHVHAYLSGLLIGNELRDVLSQPHDAQDKSAFHLLGAPELVAHYQTAATLLGMRMDLLDSRAAYLAALAHIHTMALTP